MSEKWKIDLYCMCYLAGIFAAVLVLTELTIYHSRQLMNTRLMQRLMATIKYCKTKESVQA